MSNPALRIAATGMQAQQTRTEVIANNLANVSTTGFKRSRANFEDLLYQRVRESELVGTADATQTEALQVGRGVRLSSIQRLQTQGPLERTDRALDVAIEGDGYFQVELPNGQLAYTRDGSFEISDQGVLVTAQGYALAPRIQIPNDASAVSIGKNGIVSVTRPDSTTPMEIGRIELARFVNPAGLLAQGQNLFLETANSGVPITDYPQENGVGRLEQGALEGANTQVVQEMVDMIAAQRAYELASKAIKTSDDMMATANSLVR